MTAVLMGDWSDPGTATYDAALDVAAFYCGGNTPHVWTKAQLDRQPQRYVVPIFVKPAGSSGYQAGINDGHAAVAAAKTYAVGAGRLVLDMETWVDNPYSHGFRDGVAANNGWFTVVYGSKSTVFGNHCPGGGWWVADWVGKPYEYPGDHVWATQCEPADASHPWDISECVNLSHVWDRREARPVTDWRTRLYGELRLAAADLGDLAAIVKAHGG